MKVPGFFAPLGTVMPEGVAILRNLYHEDTGDPERPYRFVRRPGKNIFVSDLHGPVRGGVELDGECHVIAGSRWYAIDQNGVATEIGEVAPDTRPSTMISNGTAGNQVAGVSGGFLYVYDRSAGTLTRVDDADLPGDILGVVHTDLYAVAWFRNSRAFRISDIGDFTAWAGGDVAERSQYVDNIVSIIADQKELQILGSQTQEQYWDSGNASFPFEPVPNALSRQGSAAVHGATLVGDTPYWVGKSPDGQGVVFRVRGGYTPERISSHWVERRIQGLTTISDAYAYSYEEHGHRFYVLSFPSADVTLCFDEAVAPEVGWHERTHLNPLTGYEDADLGRCHIYAFGRHLIGSRTNGTIYRQALSIYTDAGDPIRASRRFIGPTNEGRPVFIHEVRLDAQVGIGLSNGQGSDPQVMLRKSKDGGRTWGPELWRSLGATGEYGRRVRWGAMGMGNPPAFELAYTDPSVLGWNDFSGDFTPAAH